MACGNDPIPVMFPKSFNGELDNTNERIVSLLEIVADAIAEDPKPEENADALKFISSDLEYGFGLVIDALREMNKNYDDCCKRFEPVYKIFLGVANLLKDDKIKLKKVKEEWRLKVLKAFPVDVYLKYLQKKIADIEDKNSIFFKIMKEVANGGNVSAMLIEWMDRTSFSTHLKAHIKFSNGFKCPDAMTFSDELSQAVETEQSKKTKKRKNQNKNQNPKKNKK